MSIHTQLRRGRRSVVGGASTKGAFFRDLIG
jgi:hypothetical protein